MAATIANHLTRLTERLGRVPSATFAVAYLVAIPVFAVLYYAMPGDFYYAAAKYDTSVVHQADAVAQRIRDVYLAEAHLPPVPRLSLKEKLVGPVEPPKQRFEIQFESDHVQAVVSGEFPRRDASGKTWFGTAVLDFGHVYFEKPDTHESWDTQLVSVHVKPQVLGGQEVDLASVFPCVKSNGACLRMTGLDCLTLTELRETGAGRLSDDQDSYLRMLYFSAVTITTLGYGDIVPVASLARGVVTVEIIVGPLLFGLFLNSLVKEGARPKSNVTQNTEDLRRDGGSEKSAG